MDCGLTNDEIRALYAHALEEYPSECVGVVIGPKDGSCANEVKRLTNRQDEMQKDDPEHFDRDSRTGYFVDPKEVYDLTKQTEDEGKKVLAFYHSHPDHECYFSQTDHDGAVIWGEPVYPGAVYIIVSVFDRKVKDAQVFLWDGEKYSPSGKLPVES